MEGKWLICDRDLNEREGLKWLLKNSSIPVTSICLASSYQDFVAVFERESPRIILMELDMVRKEDWSSFRELLQIYQPILILTSAEATFEKARLALDLQAFDLMIKPYSTAKVKAVYEKAYRSLVARNHSVELFIQQNSQKHLSYESLFLSQPSESDNFLLAALKAENSQITHILYSFLADYSFQELHGVFVLSDMVILFFKDSCPNVMEQCQKAMRKWEEEFSEGLAVVVHKGSISTHQKYLEIQKMLEFTYYRGYKQMVEYESLPAWVDIDPFLTPSEQRVWIDMLGAFDLVKIKNWLYEQFLQIKEPYPDSGLLRIRLTSILAQIRRFMKTYKLDEEGLFEKEYRSIFDSILYDTVLYRTVQNLILFNQKIFEGAKRNARPISHDPIIRAISYMEAHFSNHRLKLEDTAFHVERNPSYFSHLFTSKIGKSFREVLAEIRIREGKRLLAETTKSIKEISFLVGYQNANYFSKSFKQITGMSPRDFRMNSHAQDQGL